MSTGTLVAVVALALLEGALVALPRAEAFGRLAHLRSPAWVAVLPATILVGTVGVLAIPSLALALVVLGAIATPLLAAAALLTCTGVSARWRRRIALLLLFGALAVTAEMAHGWPAQLAAAVITALACLALGMAIVSVVPRRLMPFAILGMCVLDAVLVATGVGRLADGLIVTATSHIPGPPFDTAAVGRVSTDYPDLILAAVLGATVAGDPAIQRRAAALVTLLVSSYGLLLRFDSMLPATIPLALTFVILRPRMAGVRRQALRPRAPEQARA